MRISFKTDLFIFNYIFYESYFYFLILACLMPSCLQGNCQHLANKPTPFVSPRRLEQFKWMQTKPRSHRMNAMVGIISWRERATHILCSNEMGCSLKLLEVITAAAKQKIVLERMVAAAALNSVRPTAIYLVQLWRLKRNFSIFHLSVQHCFLNSVFTNQRLFRFI